MSVTRTCVVCRRRDEKESLLRFVRRRARDVDCEKNGTCAGVELDVESRLAGRGAYCHLSSSCILDGRLQEVLRGMLDRSGGKKLRRVGRQKGTGVNVEWILGLVEEAKGRLAEVGGRRGLGRAEARLAAISEMVMEAGGDASLRRKNKPRIRL